MKKKPIFAIVVLLSLALLMFWRQSGHKDTVLDSEQTTTQEPLSTRPLSRGQDRPAHVDDSKPRSGVVAPPESIPVKANAALASPHWSAAPPLTAPVIPPGVEVSPVEVSVNVGGKNLQPKFHTSFSERMLIQAGGKAAVSVNWPAEHKAAEILASTINDGTVNGEQGVILKPGKNGKIQFTFQAGEHPGPTHVILRAANLAYTVNFLVPTGNPNVDPPALQ